MEDADINRELDMLYNILSAIHAEFFPEDGEDAEYIEKTSEWD